MRKLTLTNHVQSDTTVLENEFIDHYMAEANGEYVKVYLILLRHLNEPSGTLTISKIADLLDITEKDVIRALNYWKKKGLLDYDMPVDGETPAIPAQPRMTEEPSAPEPAAPSIQPAPTTTDVSSIEQYRSRKEFKELLFVAEQYLGKTLSHSDVESITYFYETLHMSADLIEYLIEYCVENGHTSMHYIQKVALSWCERHIKTVSEAKASSITTNRNQQTECKAAELFEQLLYLCAGKLKEQYPGGADAGGNHVYPGGSTGRQGVYPVKGKCVRGRLPGAGNRIRLLPF